MHGGTAIVQRRNMLLRDQTVCRITHSFAFRPVSFRHSRGFSNRKYQHCLHHNSETRKGAFLMFYSIKFGNLLGAIPTVAGTRVNDLFIIHSHLFSPKTTRPTRIATNIRVQLMHLTYAPKVLVSGRSFCLYIRCNTGERSRMQCA